MKKTNDSGKQAFLYVFLLVILGLACVYFLFCKKYDDKTASIKKQLPELQQRAQTLKVYYDNNQQYLDDIDSMKAEIAEKLDTFEPEVREEDIIMVAVDSLKNAEVDFTNINFNKPEAVTSIDGDTVRMAEIEGLDSALILVSNSASYVNSATYFDVKSLIETIVASKGRHTITNVNYSKNDDGTLLDGTIETNFYSIRGTNKEYVPVKMDEYKKGLEDLFNLKKKVEKSDEEENPEEAEE